MNIHLPVWCSPVPGFDPSPYWPQQMKGSASITITKDADDCWIHDQVAGYFSYHRSFLPSRDLRWESASHFDLLIFRLKCRWTALSKRSKRWSSMASIIRHMRHFFCLCFCTIYSAPSNMPSLLSVFFFKWVFWFYNCWCISQTSWIDFWWFLHGWWIDMKFEKNPRLTCEETVVTGVGGWFRCWRICIWVCLKMGYTPNYSHLVGIMIINHWV